MSTPDPNPTASSLSDEEKQIEHAIENDPDFQAAVAADVKANEPPAANASPDPVAGDPAAPSEPVASPPADPSTPPPTDPSTPTSPDPAAPPDPGTSSGDAGSGSPPASGDPGTSSGDPLSPPTDTPPPAVGDPSTGTTPVPPDVPGGPNNPTNPVEPTKPEASDADRDAYMQKVAAMINDIESGARDVGLLIPDSASLAVVKTGDWRGLGWNTSAVETPIAVTAPAPNTAMPNPEQSVTVDQNQANAGAVTPDSPLTKNADPAAPSENQ